MSASHDPWCGIPCCGRDLADHVVYRRAELFGEILRLYSDLGWSVPTSMECQTVDALAYAVTFARAEHDRRCALR